MTFNVVYFLAFALLFAWHVSAASVNFRTNRLAGGNTYGNELPATVALVSPSSIVFSPTGVAYITENNNFIRRVSTDGLIHQLAGQSNSGYSGDGGPAALATLNYPIHCDLDSKGNLYVADYYNCVIRMIATNGTIFTIAGTGACGFNGDNLPATSSQLSNPSSVKIYKDEVYLVDQGNCRIRKIVNDTLVTIAGTGDGATSGDGGPALSAGITSPYVMTFAPNGDLIFTDMYSGIIRMVNGSGIISTIAGVLGNQGYGGDGGPATQALLQLPTGIAVNSRGDVIFSDSSNNMIRKIDATTGIITRIAGTGNYDFTGDGGPAIEASFGYPTNLFISPNDDIYIADNGNQRIRVISNSTGNVTTFAGSRVFTGDGYAATLSAFNYLSDAVRNDRGETFISDANSCTVRKVGLDGIITTIAGNGSCGIFGANVPALATGFNYPQGVAISPLTNELFIAEQDAIRKVSLNGMVTHVAGVRTGTGGDGYQAVSAIMTSPVFFAVASSGEYFIVDQSESRIRKIDVNGTISTVAGTSSAGYNGDDIVATDAKLYYPSGVAVSKSGEIYICGKFSLQSFNSFQIDRQNQRIRKVSLNGNITTFAGTGTPSYSGDGGLASNAGLNYPSSIAFSPNEDLLYITDTGNSVIRMVNISTGIISTLTGSDHSGLISMVVSPIDNAIYIVDSSNCQVDRFNYDTQTYTTISGTGTCDYPRGTNTLANATTMLRPSSIAFSPSGQMVIADSGMLRVMDVNGYISNFVIDNAGITAPYSPVCVTYKDGDLFICDEYTASIRRIRNGTLTPFAGGKGDGGLATNALVYPQSVLVSKSGEIYISEGQTIRKIDTKGIISTIAGKDTRNNNNNNLRAIRAPKPSELPDGMKATEASLGGVYGRMALSDQGELFFADMYNQVIRRVSTDGLLYTVAGNGYYGYNGDNAALQTILSNPRAVAISSVGEIYFSDTNNRRIRRISNGTVTTVIGNGIIEYGDNVLGNETMLNTVYNIFLDRNGAITYIDASKGVVGIAIPFCENGLSLDDNNQTCQPTCYGIVKSLACGGSLRGSCVSNDVCSCVNGWSGSTCNTTQCNGLFNTDSAVCSSRGKCIGFNNCSCDSGYGGPNCGSTSCYGVKDSDSNVCSSHGSCTAFDQCSCSSNDYYGPNCNLTKCYGISNIDSSVCSGKGSCIGPDTCSCSSNYYGPFCNLTKCYGVLSNDANACSGKGSCTGPDTCSCNEGYSGTNCANPICFGFTSVDSRVCNGRNGTCNEKNNCVCNNGWVGLTCSIANCFGILSNDSSVCSGHGKCSLPNSCACSKDYTGAKCDTLIRVITSTAPIASNSTKVVNSSSTLHSMTCVVISIVISLLSIVISP